eukprot:3824607-Amphidinium_carterae.2
MLGACPSGLGIEEAQGSSEAFFICRAILAMLSCLGSKPMVKDGIHETELNVELYDAWARAAHDLDDEVPSRSPLDLADRSQEQQDGQVKTKRRLILECRRSTVNDAAHQNQRIVRGSGPSSIVGRLQTR